MGTLTLSEIKTRIRKVINEYSVNGEVIGASDENRLDYDLRMNSYIDMHQTSLATSGIEIQGRRICKRIPKLKKFTQYPPANAISNADLQFDIVPFTGTTLYYSGGTNAKSYCIKVDGDCTVSIQQSADNSTWTDLEVLNVNITTFGVFETFRNNITPTTDYYVRFKIEYAAAQTTFNIRSIAFYDLTYPTSSDIPVYEDYRAYSMPTDFYKLHYIVLNGQAVDNEKYTRVTELTEEGNYIYVPWTEKGEYRVHYWAYPTTINDSTSDTATLDIDDEAVNVIIYGVAMDLLESDEASKVYYQRIRMRYEEFLLRLDNGNNRGSITITNTLFSGSLTNKLF